MQLVTHSGNFHYDEVLASCMLLKIYVDAVLTRTRDRSIIEKADIVYDVGGEFDPEKKRFDHHQATFRETFSSKYKTKLSSCGLIFKYFHKELFPLYGIDPESKIYDDIVDKVYSEFFLYEDAIDNGDDVHGEIRTRTIADMVRLFNLPDEGANSELEDERFREILEIVTTDFDNYMRSIKRWADSYEYVEEKIKEATGPLLVLNKPYDTSLVLDIESKYGKDFKFMVFPTNENYRVIAIPESKETRKTKNPLKKEWRGLRDEELVRVSGIEGSIFVHATGFLGINSTFENALRMCEESLTNP